MLLCYSVSIYTKIWGYRDSANIALIFVSVGTNSTTIQEDRKRPIDSITKFHIQFHIEIIAIQTRL